MTVHKRPARDELTKVLEPLSPLGERMTLDDLPPPGTKRWVARRKAEVVSAVRGGLLTLEQACERYNLSPDEFLSWERLMDSHGLRGLHTTRTQVYRNIDARKGERPRNGTRNGNGHGNVKANGSVNGHNRNSDFEEDMRDGIHFSR